MGVKKLSRARLYNVEKSGINVLSDIGVGAAMKNSVISAVQHREGYKIITDILIDLGTSKGSILTGGNAATRPVGESSGVAKVCTVLESVFGVVTEVRTLCLEEPATDGTAYSNGLDLKIGDDGDGTQGTADGGSPAVVTGVTNIGNDIGLDKIKAYNNTANITGKSLYIASGTSLGADVKATAALTGLDGHANIATGTKLELYKADGTKVELLFDRALAHGSAQALKIGLGGGPNVTQVETSAKTAIEAVGFTTDAANGDGTLTISQTAAGPAGNSATLGADKQNSATKASGDSSSIALAQFTGGTSEGKTSANVDATFSAGKFLIRLTGFEKPTDI